VCSYSGNTEEILSVFNEAQKRKAKIICISSGGKLKKETLKQNLPFLQIPTGLPPRCTLGYSVVFILDIMHKMNIIDRKEKEIEKTGKLLKQMSSDLKVDALNNYAKKIANYLFNKYIVIYGTALTEAAAKRFDNQLSENSKTLSAYNILPELNHNHIESWQNPAHLLQEFAVVILKNNNEPFKFKRRIEATKKIIKKSNIRIIEIEASGENLLSQIFSLIYICDWVSFYLAILNGVDPTPVEKIEYLKEQLKKE
jgi:glucose/mannose-6-phosphate isomerase